MSTVNKKPDAFIEWLDKCPCVWFLEESSEDSVTYQFMVSDEPETFDCEPYEDTHDTDSIKADISSGHFDPDNLSEYEYANIVRASLINGQLKQAESQCTAYGLNYELELYKFRNPEQ